MNNSEQIIFGATKSNTVQTQTVNKRMFLNGFTELLLLSLGITILFYARFKTNNAEMFYTVFDVLFVPTYLINYLYNYFWHWQTETAYIMKKQFRYIIKC